MGKSDRAIEIGDSLVTGKTGDSLAGNSTPGWCIASLVQESRMSQSSCRTFSNTPLTHAFSMREEIQGYQRGG